LVGLFGNVKGVPIDSEVGFDCELFGSREIRVLWPIGRQNAFLS
jgi:hypothetical protein